MFRAKPHLVLAILATVTLLAGACAPSAPVSTPAEGLEDTKWMLEGYGEQGELQAVLEGTEITATFESAESRVHGSAGCNGYFADYEISDNRLSIPMVASTEMYCLEPEGVMQQENQYLQALKAAESYQIQDGKLRIICGAQILVFTAK